MGPLFYTFIFLATLFLLVVCGYTFYSIMMQKTCNVYSGGAPSGFSEDWESADWQDNWDGFGDTHSTTTDRSASCVRQDGTVIDGSYSGSITTAFVYTAMWKDVGNDISKITLKFDYNANHNKWIGIAAYFDINGTDDFEGGCFLRVYFAHASQTKIFLSEFSSSGFTTDRDEYDFGSGNYLDVEVHSMELTINHATGAVEGKVYDSGGIQVGDTVDYTFSNFDTGNQYVAIVGAQPGGASSNPVFDTFEVTYA